MTELPVETVAVDENCSFRKFRPFATFEAIRINTMLFCLIRWVNIAFNSFKKVESCSDILGDCKFFESFENRESVYLLELGLEVDWVLKEEIGC
jgi:hypothetical protein